MTNPDPRRERGVICTDGLTVEWLGDNRELVACIGCAGCESHRYREPADRLVAALTVQHPAADRAWIKAQAARVRGAKTATPMRFRAS